MPIFDSQGPRSKEMHHEQERDFSPYTVRLQLTYGRSKPAHSQSCCPSRPKQLRAACFAGGNRALPCSFAAKRPPETGPGPPKSESGLPIRSRRLCPSCGAFSRRPVLVAEGVEIRCASPFAPLNQPRPPFFSRSAKPAALRKDAAAKGPCALRERKALAK